MGSKFFEELSRCLGKEQIESLSKEDRRLEIFLHGQPVLSVSPGNEVFMLPSGSKNPEANELYHRVAIAADRVFEYVEAMENTPLLRARGLDNKFHLLADFGGAVLAGRERGTGRGYEFVTWIWDYERVGVSHGHYYEDDFAGAKRDFAVRSGLIPKASLFSNEELTEIYRATDHLLAEDPNLNDKQIRAIQEARIKIEFSVPDAVLSNPKHPEYGQFTVPLPIPHNQYDGIMEALNAMDMGDPLARDCQMDEILGEYPILKRLEGKPVNIDELDYLAKRLDSFCYAQEGAQFQGAAVSYNYSDMTDLINLTFFCQQVTVITDFSDLEQVGRDHYMVLNGGCASKEELDALDGYETALLLIDEGNGVITPYGVVYDNGMRLSQLYDGRHFPQYFYEPPLLTLTVQQSKDAPTTGCICLRQISISSVPWFGQGSLIRRI